MALVVVGRLVQWLITMGIVYLAISFYQKGYSAMDWDGYQQVLLVVIAYITCPNLDPMNDDC